MKCEGKISSYGRATGTISFSEKITYRIAIAELSLGAEKY